MWDHTDGCANQYCCTSVICLISCLALEFSIIIDISVQSPGHGNDVVGGLNARDKRMLKLAIPKLLDINLIRDNPSFYEFMQVHDH